jgi:UDP-2,4-diacetamido-2,4,6-trideoxy-beta-L-altropyranose hydrolase
MKVSIITEGNSNIGYGHITRCTSLYQAFEEKGLTPSFIVNGDKIVKNSLEMEKKYIFNWLIDKKKLYKLIDGSDIAIIDSYLANLSIYKEITNLVKIPTFIDDNIRLKYPQGIVVNYLISAKELKYPKDKEITYLLGPKYCIVRKEFWDLQEKKISKEIKTIMITFGGSDIKNLTPKVLEMINKSFPNLEKKIIIGRGFKNIKAIKDVLDKNYELIYFPTAMSMKRAMMESDLAITAGGTTIYELMIVGVPVISVAVANNQLNNVKAFSERSLNYYAGWWQNSNLLENIKKYVLLLKEEETRKNMIISGQECIKSDGSRKIINYLIKKRNLKKIN